jgi:hypothetical protein
MGIKNPKFYADFIMGQFTFVACSYQKLEQKGLIFFYENCFLAVTFDVKFFGWTIIARTWQIVENFARIDMEWKTNINFYGFLQK